MHSALFVSAHKDFFKHDNGILSSWDRAHCERQKIVHAMALNCLSACALQVSNHVASMDDPLVIASLLPPHVLMDAHNLRWTLCATDRCFKNPVTSAFFRSLKVLPVSRGDGIYQKVCRICNSNLCGIVMYIV